MILVQLAESPARGFVANRRCELESSKEAEGGEPMTPTGPTNDEIAGLLQQIADLLEQQEDNPHRVRAYRTGAETVRSADEPVAGLVRQGNTAALEELPGIGRGLAAAITEFVTDGRSSLLERLQGEHNPEALFARIPGIGPSLAGRIVADLEIETLEELEQAAHDGRLAQVAGFGPRRVDAVQATLAGRLSRSAARQSRDRTAGDEADKSEQETAERPSVNLLLELDAEYRRRAEAGELKRIAPRRFNPQNEAWLPIMHAQREGWSFTLLYSNTARAHELGTTRDWVVIYYERDGRERQNTVVTQNSGPLAGKRVVRGREPECRRYYDEA
jgi:DNA polymerase (family X)